MSGFTLGMGTAFLSVSFIASFIGVFEFLWRDFKK